MSLSQMVSHLVAKCQYSEKLARKLCRYAREGQPPMVGLCELLYRSDRRYELI